MPSMGYMGAFFNSYNFSIDCWFWPPTYYVRALLSPPTKAGLAGICKGGSIVDAEDGSLSDSVCDKSCSALGFLPPYYYSSIGFLGVSVESVTLVLLIFLSSYGGEVGKFFELVSFSASGYWDYIFIFLVYKKCQSCMVIIVKWIFN